MKVAMRVVLVVLAAGFLGCDVKVDVGDGGTGGGTGGGGGGSGGGGGGSAQLIGCSTASPCPSGQFCFNGLCALGCTSNGDCAADQYCDTEFDHLCHNKTVQTCSGGSDCFTTQECVSGFCSTPPPATQCDPDQVASGNDGCDSKSVCLDSQDTSAQDPKCHSFPPCAQDKTCPTGTQGAVCNDGLLPNKALICLVGLCRTTSNCPANWACWKFTATDVLGVCSNKGLGAPCTTGADCLSGNCTVAFPGFPGVCQ